MNHLQNSHRLFAQVGVTFNSRTSTFLITSPQIFLKSKRKNSCNKIYYVLEFCLFFRSQFSNTCTLCLCALGLLSYLTSICTTWIFFFFTLRFMVRLSVLLVTNLYSLNNFYEQIKKKLQMNVASYFEYIHCVVRVFRTAVI